MTQTATPSLASTLLGGISTIASITGVSSWFGGGGPSGYPSSGISYTPAAYGSLPWQTYSDGGAIKGYEHGGTVTGPPHTEFADKVAHAFRTFHSLKKEAQGGRVEPDEREGFAKGGFPSYQPAQGWSAEGQPQFAELINDNTPSFLGAANPSAPTPDSFVRAPFGAFGGASQNTGTQQPRPFQEPTEWQQFWNRLGQTESPTVRAAFPPVHIAQADQWKQGRDRYFKELEAQREATRLTLQAQQIAQAAKIATGEVDVNGVPTQTLAGAQNQAHIAQMEAGSEPAQIRIKGIEQENTQFNQRMKMLDDMQAFADPNAADYANQMQQIEQQRVHARLAHEQTLARLQTAGPPSAPVVRTWTPDTPAKKGGLQ